MNSSAPFLTTTGCKHQALGSDPGSPFPPTLELSLFFFASSRTLTCVGKPRLLNATRFKAKVSGHVPFGRGGMGEVLGEGQPWAAEAGRSLDSLLAPPGGSGANPGRSW